MTASDGKSGRLRRRLPLALNVAAGLAFLAASLATRRWVWTAVPIGQLFGFFLAKGDLCGASAFSEILLLRDGRKAFGLWTAIVTAMLLFAAGQAAGLATLAPKPLLWASGIVGGLVFGAGTVLAGGCVSGCLYKAAGGNLNSIVALLTIPAGIACVEHGPLTKISQALKSVKVSAAAGGPVTLSSLTGLPFWAWAVILAAVTGLALIVRRRRKPSPASGPSRSPADGSWARPWKPWTAGLALGLVIALSLASSAASGRSYPIGVTHGLLHIQELLTDNHLVHAFGPPAASPAALPAAAGRKITWWLVLATAGLFFGALAAQALSGRLQLSSKPPRQVVTAAAGGFLVGAGAALGTGCVVGNILSGWALQSVGMLVFGAAVILANWAATYFYLMNGSLRDMPGTLRLILGRRPGRG